MSWLKRITTAFSGGDRDTASILIEEQLDRDLPPCFDDIVAQTKVKAETFERLRDAAVSRRIATKVEAGVLAGTVPSQEIYEWGIACGLTADRSKKAIEDAVSEHFTTLVADVLTDGMVDPEEDRRITSFMEMIGGSQLTGQSAALIDEGRRLYRAEHGSLQAVDAPVLLKRGEYCVHVVPAEALEERSRTVRYSHSGPRARVRIMKGVSYTFGSTSVSRQTEDYQHSFGDGALCMTNRRYLWVSPQKSISIPLTNVVRFDTYRDGFRVIKGTGKPILFLWGRDDRVATVIAARVAEELRHS